MVLLVVLAVALAVATFLESNHGSEYTQWYVYHSRWFIGLLTLLGVNVLVATIIRFPWTRRRAGFFVAHVGVLVLLAGSIQSFLGGI